MRGHFSASSLPEAVVTNRQLLPPKPSSRARVASFGPHQDGTSCAVADVADSDRPRPNAAIALHAFRLDSLMVFLLRGTLLYWFETGRPIDGIDPDAEDQRERLNDGLRRIRHTDRQGELAELVEKEGRDHDRDRKPA